MDAWQPQKPNSLRGESSAAETEKVRQRILEGVRSKQ